jgi:hypothetical protein
MKKIRPANKREWTRIKKQPHLVAGFYTAFFTARGPPGPPVCAALVAPAPWIPWSAPEDEHSFQTISLKMRFLDQQDQRDQRPELFSSFLPSTSKTKNF